MSPDERVSPMWLAHHYREDYGRCVLIGRTHVCRRCLVLYPVAFAVMVLAQAGLRWPSSLDPLLLVLLPLPAVAEFVLEARGRLAYRPARQAALTLPLAAALGAGFDRYFDRHTDPLFWGVVVVYGGICVSSMFVGAQRSQGRPGQLD